MYKRQGPCLVLAGPGSGKTLTIVGRIQKLIQTYHVSPEEILVITFTKYAAVEMKNRFFSAMKGTRPAVTFGTFHGIDVYKRQAWNRSAEKTACSKVRKCAKKSEQKLRKVINKAQYIRTSYLSVEK